MTAPSKIDEMGVSRLIHQMPHLYSAVTFVFKNKKKLKKKVWKVEQSNLPFWTRTKTSCKLDWHIQFCPWTHRETCQQRPSSLHCLCQWSVRVGLVTSRLELKSSTWNKTKTFTAFTMIWNNLIVYLTLLCPDVPY